MNGTSKVILYRRGGLWQGSGRTSESDDPLGIELREGDEISITNKLRQKEVV